jgi:fused signal recognition particle receptor
VFWRGKSEARGRTEEPQAPDGRGDESAVRERDASAAGSAGASGARDETVQLAAGVEKSRRGFVSRVRQALGGGAVDEQSWEEVEETLIAADVGARLSTELVARARNRRDGADAVEAVQRELAGLFAARNGGQWPRRPSPQVPAVVLVVGVNGTGKTTTIAKLAERFTRRDERVLLAAADTFRAAAIEQLHEWARRVRVPVVAHAPGADPSAVVYDALDAAVARGIDVVIVDTAGRLHTKHNLMDELAKIRRTIDKRLPGAQPEVLFVLDATTGQNGLAQARAFHEAAPLTGIALTKLDSTAKGGIVFAIEQALGVPVRFVGTGERVEDLLDFRPEAFLAALFAPGQD